GVMAGVDEVGADLEGLHAQSAAAQGGQQSEGDRGLAGAAVRAGDDQAGRGHESARIGTPAGTSRCRCTIPQARSPGTGTRPPGGRAWATDTGDQTHPSPVAWRPGFPALRGPGLGGRTALAPWRRIATLPPLWSGQEGQDAATWARTLVAAGRSGAG